MAAFSVCKQMLKSFCVLWSIVVDILHVKLIPVLRPAVAAIDRGGHGVSTYFHQVASFGAPAVASVGSFALYCCGHEESSFVNA